MRTDHPTFRPACFLQFCWNRLTVVITTSRVGCTKPILGVRQESGALRNINVYERLRFGIWKSRNDQKQIQPSSSNEYTLISNYVLLRLPWKCQEIFRIAQLTMNYYEFSSAAGQKTRGGCLAWDAFPAIPPPWPSCLRMMPYPHFPRVSIEID